MSSADTIKRKIYFYYMDAEILGNKLNFDNFSKILKLANEMGYEYQIDTIRYVTMPRDKFEIKENSYLFTQFGFRRKKGHPTLIDQQRKTDLYPLPKGRDLFEYSHFLLLKNKVVAYEASREAPSINQVSGYIYYFVTDNCNIIEKELERKLLNCEDFRISFKQLLRPDLQEVLKKYNTVTFIDFKAKKQSIEKISKDAKSIVDEPSQMFERVINYLKHSLGLGVPYIRVSLDSGRKKESIGITIDEIIALYNFIVSYELDVSKFEIKAINMDGKKEEIDLLRDVLFTEKSIRLNKDVARSTDFEDARSKLIEGYIEKEKLIEKSLERL